METYSSKENRRGLILPLEFDSLAIRQTTRKFMGSILSAIYDDEDDWDDFLRLNEIQGKVDWQVYSNASRFAKEYSSIHGLKGNLLITAVKSRLRVQEEEEKHRNLMKDLIKVNGLLE